MNRSSTTPESVGELARDHAPDRSLPNQVAAAVEEGDPKPARGAPLAGPDQAPAGRRIREPERVVIDQRPGRLVRHANPHEGKTADDAQPAAGQLDPRRIARPADPEPAPHPALPDPDLVACD